MRLYVVVRADLPPGLQCAQACHVARAFRDAPSHDENLIVLEAPNEEALRSLLLQAGPTASCAAFSEPDLGWQLTAIALSGPKVPELVSSLPLALRDRPKLSDLTVS